MLSNFLLFRTIGEGYYKYLAYVFHELFFISHRGMLRFLSTYIHGS